MVHNAPKVQQPHQQPQQPQQAQQTRNGAAAIGPDNLEHETRCGSATQRQPPRPSITCAGSWTLLDFRTNFPHSFTHYLEHSTLDVERSGDMPAGLGRVLLALLISAGTFTQLPPQHHDFQVMIASHCK
jgi:hypothetical protein